MMVLNRCVLRVQLKAAMATALTVWALLAVNLAVKSTFLWVLTLLDDNDKI